MTLEIEREHYESLKEELLRHSEGQFAVIHDSQLLGTYTTFEEAFDAGVTAYGTKPFLIQEVTEKAREIQHPALSLGMLHAHP